MHYCSGEDIWHRKLTKIHSFGPNFLTSFYNRTLGSYNLVSFFEIHYTKLYIQKHIIRFVLTCTKWETFNILHFICSSQAELGSLSPWRSCLAKMFKPSKSVQLYLWWINQFHKDLLYSHQGPFSSSFFGPLSENLWSIWSSKSSQILM